MPPIWDDCTAPQRSHLNIREKNICSTISPLPKAQHPIQCWLQLPTSWNLCFSNLLIAPSLGPRSLIFGLFCFCFLLFLFLSVFPRGEDSFPWRNSVIYWKRLYHIKDLNVLLQKGPSEQFVTLPKVQFYPNPLHLAEFFVCHSFSCFLCLLNLYFILFISLISFKNCCSGTVINEKKLFCNFELEGFVFISLFYRNCTNTHTHTHAQLYMVHIKLTLTYEYFLPLKLFESIILIILQNLL